MKVEGWINSKAIPFLLYSISDIYDNNARSIEHEKRVITHPFYIPVSCPLSSSLFPLRSRLLFYYVDYVQWKNTPYRTLFLSSRFIREYWIVPVLEQAQLLIFPISFLFIILHSLQQKTIRKFLIRKLLFLLIFLKHEEEQKFFHVLYAFPYAQKYLFLNTTRFL